VCKPAFEVPFRLNPADKIFTIGSCFARNVEQVLMDRGFSLPAREVLKKPEFIKTHRMGWILNNYAAPSIYNEIAWAFDEEDYPAEELIAEMLPGKFVDLNFSPSLRPDSKEVVDNRRRAIREIYRSSAECRVVIMTLGLSEVWFDRRTGTYLNVSPRPFMLRNEPTRFRLHVLSHAETLGYLIKAVDLLRKHGRSDQHLILTVSPVPLMTTHRTQDVIVANTYSKSVLRAAAEEIVASYSSATYFPSYESFVLSDRKIAFVDDMLHTQMDLVSFNVGRMVDAYTASEETIASLRKAIAEGGELIAVEKANSVDPRLAEAFFVEHGEWSKQSLRFAKAQARYLLNAGRAAQAATLLAEHEMTGDLEHLTLTAEALLANGEAERALRLLELLPSAPIKAVPLWDSILAAAINVGNPDMVLAVVARVISDVKFHAPLACLHAARFFRDRRDHQKATDLYEAAFEAGATNAIILEYAESLLALSEREKAREMLGLMVAPSPEETRQAQQLTLSG
jgi:hypothetical protein